VIQEEEKEESSVMSLSSIAKMESSYQDMNLVKIKASENTAENYWANFFGEAQKEEMTVMQKIVAIPQKQGSITEE